MEMCIIFKYFTLIFIFLTKTNKSKCSLFQNKLINNKILKNVSDEGTNNVKPLIYLHNISKQFTILS